jgi:hypothetical protein
VAALTLAAAAGAFGGVSDGNYDPARMHCSGMANNVESPDYTEDGCHNSTLTIRDVGGHEYFGWGIQQTAVGEQGVVPDFLPFGLFSNVHETEYWYDNGDGCVRYTNDFADPAPPVQDACPWFDPLAPNYYGPSPDPDPASGLKIYLSFDDNLAGGEHDSSELINNGPSDGGAIRVELNPALLAPWLEAFAGANPQYILTHPLPLADAGMGFCADGICMSVQTQRQVAYQGGSDEEGKHRSVANYDGKNWDPEECSGNDDGSEGNHCDDPTTPEEEDITYWHNQEGTVYVDPGVQIYEDPDPQGSPLGPYPLPALYIGTCGVIIGGGPQAQMPDSPFSNDSGQWVIETGCG